MWRTPRISRPPDAAAASSSTPRSANADTGGKRARRDLARPHRRRRRPRIDRSAHRRQARAYGPARYRQMDHPPGAPFATRRIRVLSADRRLAYGRREARQRSPERGEAAVAKRRRELRDGRSRRRSRDRRTDRSDCRRLVLVELRVRHPPSVYQMTPEIGAAHCACNSRDQRYSTHRRAVKPARDTALRQRTSSSSAWSSAQSSASPSQVKTPPQARPLPRRPGDAVGGSRPCPRRTGGVTSHRSTPNGRWRTGRPSHPGPGLLHVGGLMLCLRPSGVI